MLLQYKDRLSNKQIRKALQNRRILEPLEDLLSIEKRKFEKLEALGESEGLYVGEAVDPKALPSILKNVKKEVDKFLRVKDISTPKVKELNLLPTRSTRSYSTYVPMVLGALKLINFAINPSFEPTPITNMVLGGLFLVSGAYQLANIPSAYYDSESSTEYVKLSTWSELPADLGHEYAHHVQFEKADSRSFLSVLRHLRVRCLAEGFAFGVERHIAKIFSERRDNPAFLYDTSDAFVSSLSIVYNDLCKKNKMERKAGLLPKYKISKPDYHSIGYTALALEEHVQDTRIYSKLINGTFKPEILENGPEGI